MENEIIVKSQPTIEPFQLHNKQLITKSKLIMLAEQSTKKSLLKTAKLFAEIQSKGLYKDDFKNIVEYGEAVFGYKQAYVYQLVNVGTECINENYECSLDNETNHYTLGQLTEALPLIKKGYDKEKLNSIINSKMTTKEIRTVVKKLLKPVTATSEKSETIPKKVTPVDVRIQKEVDKFVKKIAALLNDINDFQYTGNLETNAASYTVESIDEAIGCSVTISFRKEGEH